MAGSTRGNDVTHDLRSVKVSVYIHTCEDLPLFSAPLLRGQVRSALLAGFWLDI